MAPVLEPHYSVYPRFCQEPDLSRAGPPGAGRMGLVGSYKGEAPVRLVVKWEEWPLTQGHTIPSLIPPESAQTSTPGSRQLPPQLGAGSLGWGN